MDETEKNLFTTSTGTKGNVRCITITDNNPDHWDDIVKLVRLNYKFWAYIYHDSDVDTDSNPIAKHLHIVAIDNAGTTLKRHCERFESVIPPNMVCKVKSPRSIIRYLIHADQPEKHQYSLEDISTNNKGKLKTYFEDCTDSLSLYDDFMSVRRGDISVKDFIEKYEGEFYSLNLYQKCALMAKIEDLTIYKEDKR